MIVRGFRYRLKPTPEQAERLSHFAGVTRFVYNLAWEQRRDFWRQYRGLTGGALNFASQGRQVTELRAEVDWIREAPATALHQALRDLDKAFGAFFAGRARYPNPRRKGLNDTFRCQGADVGVRKLNGKWSAVKVPNLGWIKFRDTRPTQGRMLSATFAMIAGDWFVSFGCEIDHKAPANDLPAIGIDRGVANSLALSNGELLNITDTAKLFMRKKRAQRILMRRKRGSARYAKQRRRVARLTAKIARVRADWRHKATNGIASRFGLVAIEALRTANMTRSGPGKSGLNRSILEQGWGAFERVLSYKLEERGGTLVKVNPAYTSQECSSCGAIDKASRESQSSYACRHCGFAEHADTNAAINILRRGTASMRAEDRGCPSVETRTVNHAALAA